MVNIPEEIANLLGNDEVLDAEFQFNEFVVLTSARRMFLTNGKNVRDVTYAHVSSTLFRQTIRWPFVTVGIIAIGLQLVYWPETNAFGNAFLHFSELNTWFVPTAILGGIAAIIFGVKAKNYSILLNVSGMSETFKLSGQKDQVQGLHTLLSKRRFQVV